MPTNLEKLYIVNNHYSWVPRFSIFLYKTYHESYKIDYTLLHELITLNDELYESGENKYPGSNAGYETTFH